MLLNNIIPPYKGGLYYLPDGSAEDLSKLIILSHSVDTVNQFFYCRLKKSFFTKIKTYSFPVEYEIDNHFYTLTRMGSKSSYQYSIQSKKLGIQVFLKSFYSPISKDDSHIKVALSPDFLIKPIEIQKEKIDSIVSHLTHFAQWMNFSIHYAIDFQLCEEGVNYVEDVLPDFQSRLKGFRAHKCYVNEGLVFDLKDFNLRLEGRKGIETITLGSANAFQLTCYRKDLEMVSSNKSEYCKDLWGTSYDPLYPVFRLELRMHQEQLKTYDIGDIDYLKYLKKSDFSLIKTFMVQRARYMDSTKTVIDPLWYELLASFNTKKLVSRLKVKKDPYKTLPNSNMALGNMVGLYMKLDIPTDDIVNQILEISILRCALVDKFSLLATDPEIELKLKSHLIEYVEKRYEQFRLETH